MVEPVAGGTSSLALTDWIVAALLLGAAVAAAFYPVFAYDAPWVFDPYDPEFNPAIFVPVFLFFFGMKHLLLAIHGVLLGRRFGESVMQLDREAVAVGEALKGVIRATVHFVPLGDYEVRLQCVKKVASTMGMTTRLSDSIVHEQTMQVSAQQADPRKGIPFAFRIPEYAPSTTVSGTSAFDLIGQPAAGEVRWILEVKAPLRGLNYYAIFGIHVSPRAAKAT